MRTILPLVLALCVSGSVAQMLLKTSAFEHYGRIPDKFCCDSVERDPFRPSIPFEWMRVPVKAHSFILILDDMEEEKIQWVVKDIPRDTRSLDADCSEVAMPVGSVELPNSFGTESYSAPCPETEGEHHYRVRLYAMPRVHTVIYFPSNLTNLRSPHIISQIEKDALYVAIVVGNYSFTPEQLAMAFGRRNPLRKPSLSGEFPWDNDKEYLYGPRRGSGTGSYDGTGTSAGGDQSSQDVTNSHDLHIYGNRTLTGKNETRVRAAKLAHALFANEGDGVEVAQRAIQDAPVTPRYGGPAPTPDVKPLAINGSRRARPEILEPIEKQRFVKPSEAFRRGVPQPDSCRGATAEQLDECIALQTQNTNVWTCSSRSNTGMRFTGSGETERCDMRVRFADLGCDSQVFPLQNVCSRNNTRVSESPAVEWIGAPEETKSFILTFEDASVSPKFADSHGKLYWVVANIPVSTTSISSGASSLGIPPMSVELKNSFHFPGYTPPCPGALDDRMFLARLYAMPHSTTTLFLPTEVSSATVLSQLQKLAICITSTQVPFSFSTSSDMRRSVVPAPRDIPSNSASIVQPGESAPELI